MVPFDQLSITEQRALEGLSRDPDCYGILRAREDARLSVKAVSRDAALLLLDLQTAGALPHYALELLGERCDSILGQMVLDGILEIEVGGRMQSGPAAYALTSERLRSQVGRGSLAELSHRALEYAERLALTDAAALSTRLYTYNRVPASLRWRRLLSDRGAVETHLGVRDGETARALANSWMRLQGQEPESAWMGWQSRYAATRRDGAVHYKLYVSPACTELRTAFTAVAESVSRSAAFHWKVGSNVYGLLRPDKIVLYFWEFSDLQATAADLGERLAGCPPHGVPFTAEIAPDGLLSWGIDPPIEKNVVPWLGRESWRGRICDRLAVALVLLQTAPQPGVTASSFATERLRLEGIDTATWAPLSRMTSTST